MHTEHNEKIFQDNTETKLIPKYELEIKDIEAKIQEIKDASQIPWNKTESVEDKKEVTTDTRESNEEMFRKLSADDAKYFRELLKKKNKLEEEIKRIKTDVFSVN